MNSSNKKRAIALAAVLAIALQSTSIAAFADDDIQQLWNSSSVAASDASAKASVSKLTGLKVGQTVQGFTVKEIRKYKPLQADVILLEHDKTGAKFMYIANDDTERSFSLAFRTVAEDETGKPHIFEHSTLNGSDKYPANAFMNLLFQTYNTFMNAFTFPTQTMYPVASLSEEQLLKYTDLYTDACFHPLIMQDENIFKQEAWRYRLEKTSGDLTVEGTVYSEMLAASDISNAANLANLRTAFPGSTISNSYGGDPNHIPELTYEELRDYHNKYYHPSNCLATLYGKIDNFESFAKILNKEFSKYKKESFTFEDPDFKPITGPVSSYEAFPASADEDTSNQSIVCRDYVLRDISNSDLKKAYLLSNVLNDDNSPIIAAIKKYYPQSEVSIGIETGGPENLLKVSVSNVEKDDAKKITAIIDGALKKIAKDGISDKIIEKIEHSIKMSNLLSGEGTNKGVNVATELSYMYANTGDIWFAEDIESSVDKIGDYNKNGVFKDILTKYVTNNKLRVLSVTYPEKGLLEKVEAERKQKLADKKASMSKAELKELVKQTKEFDSRIEADDAAKAEIVAKVKGVNLKTLPEEVPDIKADVTKNDNNVRTITANADVNGIGSVQISLDVSDFTVEEAMWAELYASMMFEADTTEHKAKALKDMRDLSAVGFSASLDTTLNKDRTEFTPIINMSWQVLDEDIEESFDVVNEVLTKTKTNQGSKILGAAEAEKYYIKSNILASGGGLIKNGGLDSASGNNNYIYRTQFLEYYNFLNVVTEKLQSDPAYVIKNLNNAKKKLANAYGATFGYAGDKKGISAFKKASSAFADKLGYSPKTRAEFEKKSLGDAYIVNSGANFNYKFMSFKDMGVENVTAADVAEMDIVSTMITDAFLMPYLRNYYGAYGAYSNVNKDGIILYTYRDPNIAETYAVYNSLGEGLAAIEVDQDTLDGYIMSQYSNLIQSMGPLSDASIVVSYAFDERDYYDEVKDSLKALKAMTPERVNEIKTYFAKVATEGNICTVGTPASVQENSKLFKDTVTPFSE